MKSLHSFGFACALLGGFASVGCASAMPSQDLLDARAIYAKANQGAAPGLNPADLHTAKQQLDLAEAAFVKEGDTQNSRDQAYLAARKTQLAEVVARTRLSSQTKDGVVSAMHADERKTVALTAAELGRAKTELNVQGAALQNERDRREAAEKRAAQAAADLAKFATVKQETRGMVITLSGAVLFASDKSSLLPSAQLKLNEVASALTKEDPLSKIVVEGHTDSQGTAAYNQDLSTRRAQAVRDYLVSRGVASDRITSQGFGPSRSIADNASPEGRANNRRVEIVVVPSASTP